MDDETFDRLNHEANEAFQREDYETALNLWVSLEKEHSRNPYILSNIGLAFMKMGRLEAARDALMECLSIAPLSRALNSLLAVLIRLGADPADLLDLAAEALVASKTVEELRNHFHNFCLVCAYGPDHGSVELMVTIRDKALPNMIQGAIPAEHHARAEEFFGGMVNGYISIAHYREHLSRKEWFRAEAALQEAKAKFATAGHSQVASGLDGAITQYFHLCKQTFSFLERLALGAIPTPTSALEEASVLLNNARMLREKRDDCIQLRLLDVLGWFLAEFVTKLRYLTTPGATYLSGQVPLAAIRNLASVNYQSLGADLGALLNCLDQLCQRYDNEVKDVASETVLEDARRALWTRIALNARGLTFQFQGVDLSVAHGLLGWNVDPVEDAKHKLKEFRALVERQAHRDVFVADKPQENIARSQLQMFLSGRSYREVPIRGGNTDILVFSKDGTKLLFETKIWRGPEYHEQGLRELEEYIKGENDDGQLKAAFYVVFDPTRNAQGQEYQGGVFITKILADVAVDVVMVRLRPPTPSKKTSDE